MIRTVCEFVDFQGFKAAAMAGGSKHSFAL